MFKNLKLNKYDLLIEQKSNRFLSLKNRKNFFRKYKKYNQVDILEAQRIDNNTKPVKIRNPGIDFVRILSMYAIIIHHILIHTDIYKKYSQYRELKLMNMLTFWHVSSYGLISGYVGYKTNKYSNLLYLMIWTLFYSCSLTYYINKYNPQFNTRKLMYKDFFPVVYEAYWYFTQYFGMYLFLPVINKGIKSLKKNELRTVFLSLIFAFVVVKDYMNPKKDPFKMAGGYSSKWLLICFLAGAYLGKFKKNYYGIKIFILFFLCIIIFYYSAYLCYILTYYSIDNAKGFYKIKVMIFLKSIFVMRISSVPMICESFSVLIFFTHIKYNKYLAKIIIFIGPLTFGIFLIHYHPIVKGTILKNLFLNDPKNLPLNKIIKLVLFRGINIFLICLIIDYLRHILFTILKIKKICIYFEKKIT